MRPSSCLVETTSKRVPMDAWGQCRWDPGYRYHDCTTRNSPQSIRRKASTALAAQRQRHLLSNATVPAAKRQLA
ncbi:hypothetical protein N9N28_10415 [Rubripirellula amarantea]|nr:hypothetical protein [Rubripirellula amarantea]